MNFMLSRIISVLASYFGNLFMVVSVGSLTLLIPNSRYLVHAWYVTHLTYIIWIKTIIIG